MQRPVQSVQRPVAAVAPVPFENYMTKEEVGRAFRVPLRTVERWMWEGILPFFKVKRLVRFRWSVVQAHWTARYLCCLKRGVPVSSQEGPRTTDHGLRTDVLTAKYTNHTK